MGGNYQRSDAKETERFWTKIWQKKKKNNENAEWINNIIREQEGLEEGPKTEIHFELLEMTLKRISWLLVQEIHLHSRQTSTRNEQMPTRRTSTWQYNQKKDYINPKGPKQRNCSKQLQTDNLPTNDVENTNSTNKEKDLLLANKPWIVPWRIERLPQRIQMHSRITLHRSTHPKWEQEKTEKSS